MSSPFRPPSKKRQQSPHGMSDPSGLADKETAKIVRQIQSNIYALNSKLAEAMGKINNTAGDVSSLRAEVDPLTETANTPQPNLPETGGGTSDGLSDDYLPLYSVSTKTSLPSMSTPAAGYTEDTDRFYLNCDGDWLCVTHLETT